MTFAPKDPVVWTEIRMSDLVKATAFYGTVLQNGMRITTDMGPTPMAVFPAAEQSGVAGNLVEGTHAAPGTGNIIHLAIPDTLAEVRKRVIAAGSTASDDDMTIPSGTFFYASDPDGKTTGFYRPKG
ncbi:hypothetical protein SAMN04488092_103179 [Thalassovita taeanensis]|uniref:Enzyme related to lactoylglutathione lyase n=2 Tax=Thalassovita taeanensis TaxID=657014 RepID=A0A1H9CA40_9RHOB|nr:hypothetical protein SAMN04488092_103179 [Thalassovita taeanensis]